MSKKDFIYQINIPSDSGDDAVTLFVYPGLNELNIYPGKTSELALTSIVNVYGAANLACEPELETLCSPLGIISEPFDALRLFDLSLNVYENVDPGSMEDIENLGIVYQFASAATEFQNEFRWNGAPKYYRLEIKGDENYKSYAIVFGDKNKPKGIALFDTAKERDKNRSAISKNVLETEELSDCLVVLFKTNPKFAIDALHRGFGLKTFPEPMVIMEGEEERPLDTDLAVLIGAMFALPLIKDGETESNGRIELGDLQILVNAFSE